MSRRKDRKDAFALVFERLFHNDPVDILVENAGMSREYVLPEFTRELVYGVDSNIEVINDIISKNIKDRSISYLSKTATAILQLAVFEICISKQTPEKVAINEAVELAKEFGGEKEPVFINGVLGNIVKGSDIDDKK